MIRTKQKSKEWLVNGIFYNIICLQAVKSVWAPVTIPWTRWRLSCRTSLSDSMTGAREVRPGGKTSSWCHQYWLTESVPSHVANCHLQRCRRSCPGFLTRWESFFLVDLISWSDGRSSNSTWSINQLLRFTSKYLLVFKEGVPNNLDINMQLIGFSCWHNFKISPNL